MILLCGIASETPLRLVRERLESEGTPFVLFHQRQFADARIWYEIDSSGVRGELTIAGKIYKLEDFDAAYLRLMDDRNLPEIMNEPADSALRQHCRSFHDALNRWLEIAPGRIVNRAAPQGSNFSKPFQAQLLQAQGFLTPETLITNEPELVKEFHRKHGTVIYKSISSVRSIVQRLEEADYLRLDRIRWCPTQFQAFVPGTDVRVHTIGQEAHAVAISSDATDYRYATKQTGEAAELREVILSEELRERCCNLSRTLGLDFAGVDLKITPEDEVYCFEVNPCPAFSYYELSTGAPISATLAKYLTSAEEGTRAQFSESLTYA